MRRLKLAVAATITATLTVPSAATPLIGGEETGASQYTNVGAFGVVIDGTFFEICTGTLVATNVVLTAGHCTFFFEDLETRAQPFDIVFTLDPSPTASSTTYDAVAFYTHPEYIDELRGNSKCGLFGQCTTDVGLVVLETSPGVAPASLAPEGYVDTLDLKSEVFTIVGYGLEGFVNANTPIGTPGGTRKFGAFRAVGQDVTSDRFLKLSGRHSGAETCFGDSGGPVFPMASSLPWFRLGKAGCARLLATTHESIPHRLRLGFSPCLLRPPRDERRVSGLIPPANRDK